MQRGYAATGEFATCELLVDKGSSVSIIPETLYNRHFSACPLTLPEVKLVTYLKENIPVLGCLKATVSMDSATAPAFLYVVRGGSALLGMDPIRALNWTFTHKLNQVSSSATDQPSPSAAAPAIETTNINSSFGCVTGFVHKVKVREDAVPVQQRLRRLPFAVRQAVSDELDMMLKEGIIERIDASP